MATPLLPGWVPYVMAYGGMLRPKEAPRVFWGVQVHKRVATSLVQVRKSVISICKTIYKLNSKPTNFMLLTK